MVVEGIEDTLKGSEDSGGFLRRILYYIGGLGYSFVSSSSHANYSSQDSGVQKALRISTSATEVMIICSLFVPLGIA